MKDAIKIVVKQVGENAYPVTVDNTLEMFQMLVGGYIQCVHIYDNIFMICNEDGKNFGFAPNFCYYNDIICGTACFVGCNDEGDFMSLSKRQQDDILESFE